MTFIHCHSVRILKATVRAIEISPSRFSQDRKIPELRQEEALGTHGVGLASAVERWESQELRECVASKQLTLNK